MPKLNQQGVITQLLILLLLGAGLAVGIYLVSNKTNIFSKASVSQPIGPETSFTVAGPKGCTGWFCVLPGQAEPQEEFDVKVYVRSDVETANLFTARINFPADLVEVTQINTEGSFIQNWVENYYDNATGEISLTGGVPTPGYQTQEGGEAGLMATIIFKAKSIGKGQISFADDSAIFSDTNNINILLVKRPYDISVEVKAAPTISAPIPPSTETASPQPSIIPVAGMKGDVNGDGKVNLIDMSKMLSLFGKTGQSAADINGDGIINTIDVLTLRLILIENGIIRVRK